MLRIDHPCLRRLDTKTWAIPFRIEGPLGQVAPEVLPPGDLPDCTLIAREPIPQGVARCHLGRQHQPDSQHGGVERAAWLRKRWAGHRGLRCIVADTKAPHKRMNGAEAVKIERLHAGEEGIQDLHHRAVLNRRQALCTEGHVRQQHTAHSGDGDSNVREGCGERLGKDLDECCTLGHDPLRRVLVSAHGGHVSVWPQPVQHRTEHGVGADLDYHARLFQRGRAKKHRLHHASEVHGSRQPCQPVRAIDGAHLSSGGGRIEFASVVIDKGPRELFQSNAVGCVQHLPVRWVVPWMPRPHAGRSSVFLEPRGNGLIRTAQGHMHLVAIAGHNSVVHCGHGHPRVV
mmetsp:Transcript_147106/g.382402  ORF Transcript_147106/g.382402 Transcript_147106/m.382402 type:complete len:344 (+) Transcript_147106:1061-2092(+)